MALSFSALYTYVSGTSTKDFTETSPNLSTDVRIYVDYPILPFRYNWHEVQITRCFLRAISEGGDGEKGKYSTYEEQMYHICVG